MIKLWHWFKHLFGHSYQLESYSGRNRYGNFTNAILKCNYCGKEWKVFKQDNGIFWRDWDTANYISIYTDNYIENQIIVRERNVTK